MKDLKRPEPLEFHEILMVAYHGSSDILYPDELHKIKVLADLIDEYNLSFKEVLKLIDYNELDEDNTKKGK